MTTENKPVGWWCPRCGPVCDLFAAPAVKGCCEEPIPVYTPLATPEPSDEGPEDDDVMLAVGLAGRLRFCLSLDRGPEGNGLEAEVWAFKSFDGPEWRATAGDDDYINIADAVLAVVYGAKP